MIGKSILHYKILEKLGEGGMGIVYLAEDNKLKRQVAIKFLPGHIAANSDERQRFEIEAQAAAALNHPNIATIYAIDEADDQLFLVMEYIEGKELKDVINNPSVSPLSKGGLWGVLDYTIQIADGLKTAHEKGIIHRDIKSSNIMITHNGQVKIMDFGLAKFRDSAQLTQIGTTIGTAAYMSPEQARGEDVDYRTDIWSFGIVVYEMLTGRLPFPGDYEQAIIYNLMNIKPDDIHKHRSDITIELKNFIEKLLAKNPDDRFQSFNEIIDKLNKIKAGSEILGKGPNEVSIAVLPFADMSPAKDQDYFCEGVAEEILNSLNKIEGLRVASRTSSFLFKKKESDVKEIGKMLNVFSVLEGSVRKAGNMLRVNVQLTNVDDGFNIWSERYDRELEDVFAIQENIAENVATALRGVLTSEEKQAIQHPQTDIEAYEYFLKGRYLLNQLDMNVSRTMFEKAVEKDPGYAPAYSGLSNVHSWLYEWWGTNAEDLKKAEQHSLKALELAPHSAESHTAYGYVLSLQKRYDEAEKEFQRAIDIDINAYDAYYYYARTSFARGEVEKSTELFRNAADARREDFQSVALLSQSLRVLGRNDEAAKTEQEAVRRAKRQLELDPNNRRVLSLGAQSLFFDGQDDLAFKWMEKALKLYPDDAGVMLNSACLLIKAHREDEALDMLEKVLGKGYGKRDWIEHDPDYDTLRYHPRFIKLLDNLK